MPPSSFEEARAFQSVRRCCYAGLDSVTFREEVIRRLQDFLPFDAHTFALTDPDTGLFTHGVAQGIPDSLDAAWKEYIYPYKVAEEILDMARNGAPISIAASSVVMELLRPEGFGHDLRGVLSRGGDPWGFVCLLRGSDLPAYEEREAAFVARLRPHLSRGLRTAVLRDGIADGQGAGGSNGAGHRNGAPEGEGGGPFQPTGDAALGPGILVLDARGRLQTRNRAAASYLRDLEDVGRGPEVLPHAVGSAVIQMGARIANGAEASSGPLDGRARARGRSGHWYTIRASMSEPDASGLSSTIVLIEPARSAEIAPLLTRLYGLTPREREVLALAAKGRSTKWIARDLGISPYTVQEHLGNACAKAGVRTRKELLAKLFFDGYAPGLGH